MKRFVQYSQRSRQTTALAVGAGVGLAAGALIWYRYRAGLGGLPRRLEAALAALEEDVVDVLRADDRLSGLPIEVSALARGIVELSGTVETEDDSERAVAAAQRVMGVRTVLNRLDVLEELERADGARYRPRGPGTAMADTRWEGMGVGMGRRRQGRQTDPGRRDDRVDMLEDALGVHHMVEQTSEILDKIPNATEGQATAAHSGPDDRGTIREASHRGTGNANPFPQDRDRVAGSHENVKPGTELDLEEAGLEGELQRRNLKGRS